MKQAASLSCKKCKKVFFYQRLECSAPKWWSKYTTSNTFIILIYNIGFEEAWFELGAASKPSTIWAIQVCITQPIMNSEHYFPWQSSLGNYIQWHLPSLFLLTFRKTWIDKPVFVLKKISIVLQKPTNWSGKVTSN